MPSNDRLSWRGKWQAAPLEQETPDDCGRSSPLYPLQDGSVTEHFIPMIVTGDQWTKLLDCVQIGAATIYPDERENIISVFLNSVECYMDLCALIAQCIDEADEGSVLYDALNQWLAENGYVGSNASGSVGGTLAEIISCDPDNIFATTLQLVQLFNAVSSDLYDRVELTANQAAAFGALFELVPPIGQVIEVAEVIATQLVVSYDASYNVTLEQDLACRWFCLMLDNDCVLTLDMLLDDLADLMTEPISLAGDFEDAIDFLLGQQWSGDKVVYATFAALLVVIKYGSSWLGMTFVRLQRTLAAIANDTNSDWTVLCDECVNTWCYTFDFSASDGGWHVYDASGAPGDQFFGTYDAPGGGWVSTQVLATSPYNRRGTLIEVDFVATEITEVEMVYDMSYGATAVPNVPNTVIRLIDAGTVVADEVVLNTPPEGEGVVSKLEIPSGATGAKINIGGLCGARDDGSTTDPGGEMKIKSVTVRGKGTNPFGSDNC